MSVRVKLYDKDVNEEEVEQGEQSQSTNTTQQQSNTADNADKQKIQSDYAVVQAKLAEIDRRYNAEKQPWITKKAALKQQAGLIGLVLGEGKKYSFNLSTKLYESVLTTGKTDELIAIINATFDALPDLSYYMDKKGCTSLAKRMLSFLNDQHWNDGTNHWSDVAEFVTNTIGRANISLSTKEVSKFIGELSNQMANSSVFVWIFGNQQPTEVEEVVDEEEPLEDLIPEETEIPEETYSTAITPEDEESLLGFAEPVEEVPAEEYAEEIPQETYDQTAISADDEEALAQYAEPYEEEDEYTLNEGKVFRNIQKRINGVFGKYDPDVLHDNPDMPYILKKTLQSCAKKDEQFLSEVWFGEEEEDDPTSYEMLKGRIRLYKEFWKEYHDLMEEDDATRFSFGQTLSGFPTRQETNSVFERWKEEILNILYKAAYFYRRQWGTEY